MLALSQFTSRVRKIDALIVTILFLLQEPIDASMILLLSILIGQAWEMIKRGHLSNPASILISFMLHYAMWHWVVRY